jgi:hypothetical protein
MAFDIKTYQEAACLSEGCFDYSQKSDTKAAIKASLWVEGEVLPKVGDVITVYDETAPTVPKTVTLTTANLACELYGWLKLKSFNCFDGDASKNMWWFPQSPSSGLRNATRPDWEVEYETLDDEDMAWPIGVKATTRFNLNLLKNQCWYNSLIRRKPKLSFVNFLDNGVEILPYGTGRGKFESVIKKGSYALEDPKTTVNGMVEVMQRGKEAPCFYACDDDDYSDKIQVMPAFTFKKADAVTTGLTASICGTKSACSRYDAVVGAPFSFLLAPEQAPISTCFSATLLDACGVALAPALLALVTVDGSTGKVDSTGLPAGEYGFTIIYENECCVSGATCFNVTVK